MEGIEYIDFSYNKYEGTRFENKKTGVSKILVDKDGKIQDFPGIKHPRLVSKLSKLHTDYLDQGHICYPSEFTYLEDGHYALVWQITPDGRYYEDDDGFGGTSDDEIDLYARIDETGEFIEQFCIYRIGCDVIYGTDEEDRMVRQSSTTGKP